MDQFFPVLFLSTDKYFRVYPSTTVIAPRLLQEVIYRGSIIVYVQLTHAVAKGSGKLYMSCCIIHSYPLEYVYVIYMAIYVISLSQYNY